MRARARQRASLLVVLVTAVLVTAACGSSGGNHTSSRHIQPSLSAAGTDAHEDADTVCGLVTQADASKLFGGPARRNANSSLATAEGACIWNATRAALNYTLISRIYDTTAALTAAKAAAWKSVPGIGDRAYVSEVGPSAYEVWFAKGSRVARLRFVLSPTKPGSPPPNAAAKSAAVLALARELSTRL